MVRAKEIEAEHQPLSFPPAPAWFQVPPQLVNQLHSPLRFQVHLHTQVENHGPSRFRDQKECIRKPGKKGKRRRIPRGKLCHGEGCTNNPSYLPLLLAARTSGASSSRLCPSQCWWMRFGRLQPKPGKQGEQLQPDGASELRFRKATTEVRWARCRPADKVKGARQATILP